MSNKNSAVLVAASGPSYIRERADLLTQVALTRFGELSLYPAKAKDAYDFLVTTREGKCFLIVVEGFSSIRLDLECVETRRDLSWQIDPDTLRWAVSCPTQVFLFVVDADTGHGRYLRLNDQPLSHGNGRLGSVELPIENTLDEAGIRRLLTQL